MPDPGRSGHRLRQKPRLTGIEIGYDRIGYTAAELLDRLMRGLEPPTEPIRVSPRGLVVRESTDFFAVDNDLVAAALAYVASHSHRRIGPDDVARAVATSTRTLQNRFRKTLKRRIATEIRRVRFERRNGSQPRATGRSRQSPATPASGPFNASTKCSAENST